LLAQPIFANNSASHTSRVSRAFHTSPMPPAPIFAAIS
jgi:hypothetical protein